MTDHKDQWITPNWQVPAHIKAISTTRQGGFSQKPWDSLNLGAHVNDDPQRVEKNRQVLSQQLKLKQSPIWLNQIHQNRIIKYTQAHQNIEADGIISEKLNQVCAVMTADCLPVLISDQRGQQVAAVHAGWRGLANNILITAINAFHAPAKALVIWLGPCIGAQKFEVGEEVYHRFKQQDPQYSRAFVANRPKHYLLNLHQLARMMLEKQGVQQIYQHHDCTYSNQHDFFSYRRDGECGRMASLIWIEPK